MAMVHAAKMDSDLSNDKINELIAKAEALFVQLSKFHAEYSGISNLDET